MEVLVEEFEGLKSIAARLDDPRTQINIFHPVENIIAISIAAIISGAEGSKSIARWAKEKKDWLNTWLHLPDGRTPSRDCVRTFFAIVEPAAFQACFLEWLNGFLPDDTQREKLLIIPIDGKTL